MKPSEAVAFTLVIVVAFFAALFLGIHIGQSTVVNSCLRLGAYHDPSKNITITCAVKEPERKPGTVYKM